MSRETKDNICSAHLIEWDWKNPVVADDDLSVTFEGCCDRCQRRFQVTFWEPKYSVMDIDKKGNDTGEWQNYTMIGNEAFAN